MTATVRRQAATDALSTLDAILARGTIRVAVTWSPPPETGFPPEFYLDPSTGKPEGMAVILARLLAGDLGVEAEFVDGPWGDQFDALDAGRVDLLPKPTMTPERALRVEFSSRLVPFHITPIVRRDRSLHLDDLALAGFRFSVWEGSSIVTFLRRRFPEAEIVEFRDGNAAKDAAAAGVVDAEVSDALTKIALARWPALDLVRGPDGARVVLASEWGHFGVRRGDQRFLNYLNSWIAYQRHLGVLDRWCIDWWLSFMAD